MISANYIQRSSEVNRDNFKKALKLVLKLKIFKLSGFILIQFTLLAIIISPYCNAQIKILNFNDYERYTEESGLPSSYITNIQEDKNGFLWIATSKGISRYDGNHFTNFTHYFENSLKYEIGTVHSIVFDQSGQNVFIGSDSGILYTPIDKIRFIKFKSLTNNIKISDGIPKDLLLDEKNTLWLARSEGGLFSFDFENSEHEIFSFESSSQEHTSSLNNLSSIKQDPTDNNILWIGTGAGLIRFNRILKDYQVFVFRNYPAMAQNSIRKIQVSNKEVFLGTWHEGLVIFNKQSKLFSQPLKAQYPKSHTLILDFYKEEDVNLWVTSQDGLIQYDLQSGTVNKILDHNTEKGKFTGISFIDSRGIIWFGNGGKGLFKYNPKQYQNTFITLEKRIALQDPMLVREIIYSNNNIYVLGHGSKGLYRVNTKDWSVETIKLPTFDYHRKAGYNLRDMVEMENGNFLIISDHNISIFDPVTQQIELSPLQIDHPFPSLQAVVKDKNNNFWIGSRVAGLFCLNFENNSVKNYREQFNDFKDENHKWIEYLYIDSSNRLWIRNAEYLSVMDLKNFSIQNLNPIKHKYIYNNVGGFVEDSKKRIWIAGKDEGIGFIDTEDFGKGIIGNINGQFNKAYQYNDSLLWTIGGSLGTINLNTRSYNEVYVSPGKNTLKLSGPIISMNNNEFIIGYDNGILIYEADKQQINKEIPRPYIREITANTKTLYKGNRLTNDVFNFKSGTKHLVILISSLGFSLSDQIIYKYKLDDEWQSIGSSKEINLTNLSNGKYKLEIKACNNLGICNENPVEYNIIILTPWWLAWWAYLIYLGIVILLAYWFYSFQLSKKLAVAESLRLLEINQFKNSLYTNITHEFRTPLTVILGITDTLKQSSNNKPIRKSVV